MLHGYTVWMATIAGLYKVRGPNGVYYAVHDPASGRVWTERSEQSARAQAHDAGLDLAPERSITHQALMQMTGRGNVSPPKASSTASTTAATPPSPRPPAPPRAISSRSPFAQLDSNQPVLTSQAKPVGDVFSADAAVERPQPDAEDPTVPSAGAALNRDVLSEKRPLKGSGKNKNPFADRQPKRRD
jgi:hypothetical protein